MLSYSFYERDNRVIRYAEALAQCGDQVDVLSLRADADASREEVINGVQVHRLQDRIGKTERTKVAFLWPILRFLLTCSVWIVRAHRSRPFDVVHVHNVPDFLVLAALPARLSGARVILDIHDILPEFYASKFRARPNSLLVRGLKIVERVSAALADHVILANHLWFDRYSSRSAHPEKCSVLINHVDEQVFRSRPDSKVENPPIVMFPGGLQWHQGLDIAIRAFAKVRQSVPEARFHIYGDGSVKLQLVALAEELGLRGHVRFFEPVSIRAVAEFMARAALGVVPKRAESFGNEAYSTKIMEFMALGVPMVVSSTKVDRFYFDDATVRFFEAGNVNALAQAMVEVLRDDSLRKSMIQRGLEYAGRNSWQHHKAEYLRLVDSVLAAPRPNWRSAHR